MFIRNDKLGFILIYVEKCDCYKHENCMKRKSGYIAVQLPVEKCLNDLRKLNLYTILMAVIQSPLTSQSTNFSYYIEGICKEYMPMRCNIEQKSISHFTIDSLNEKNNKKCLMKRQQKMSVNRHSLQQTHC
jgi:hypothetical protein